MNIELAFVNAYNSDIVRQIVERRLFGDLKDIELEYNTKVEDSYDIF